MKSYEIYPHIFTQTGKQLKKGKTSANTKLFAATVYLPIKCNSYNDQQRKRKKNAKSKLQ